MYDVWFVVKGVSFGSGPSISGGGSATGAYRFYKPSGGSWTTQTFGFVDGTSGQSFGKAAPGKTYPAWYFYGWTDVTTSGAAALQVGTNQTFNLTQTGITYNPGTQVRLYAGSSNYGYGVVVSSNPTTGTVVLNISAVVGTPGTYSGMHLTCWGLWQTPDVGVTWNLIAQYLGGRVDIPSSICADPDIYGRVYVCSGGGGYTYI